MIEDARVLRDEFLPGEVCHRDQEVNGLTSALEPIMEGDPGDAAVIFGPSGTGKTCIARYTVEKLREEVLDINSQYVNCWTNHSTFRVLEELCQGINRGLDIHRQSTPTDELLERLREYDGSQYVVILDEVDQLDEFDIIYDLHSIPTITPVLIANEEDQLFARMDDRIVSRFRGVKKLSFQKYGVSELVSILDDRVKWGLRPGAIDRNGLELISDAAAGDARVAITILRNAAQTAQDHGEESITTSTITEAVSEGKTEIKQATLSRLTDHQQVIYSIVQENEELSSSELYDIYRDRVDDPKSDRQVRNYLSKLQHYNLIEAEGKKRWRRYSIIE